MHDPVHRFHIIVFQAAPKSVGQKFFGQATVKVQAMVGDDRLFDLANIVEGFACDQLSGRVDALTALAFAPHAQRVEVL